MEPEKMEKRKAGGESRIGETEVMRLGSAIKRTEEKKSVEKRMSASRPKIFIIFFLALFFLLTLLNTLTAQNRSTKKEAAVKPVAPAGKSAAPAKSSSSQKSNQTSKAADNLRQTQPSSTVKGIPEATLKILKENRFLEEELKLAKNPQYYFVLNLKEKTLELRARGMVLKSWKASELRYSGKPVPLKVTTLTHKTALKPPERKVLNPAEAQAEETKKTEEKARQEENNKKKKEDEKETEKTRTSATTPTDTFEVEALEITDMPGSYELNFDDGLQIFVRSKSGFSERFRQARENLLWYTWYPVKHFLFRKSELKPRLILYFDNQRDAQGIYWAFIDGLKGIVWFP